MTQRNSLNGSRSLELRLTELLRRGQRLAKRRQDIIDQNIFKFYSSGVSKLQTRRSVFIRQFYLNTVKLKAFTFGDTL